MKKAKAGLFGIGLDTYWSQFPRLLSNLNQYQQQISKKIESYNIEVANAGLVDTPKKAVEVAEMFRRENVDIVFVYIATYALSSTVLPVARHVKAPIVLLNLQPVSRLDYEYLNALKDRGEMTGVWLEHCQACSLPEISAVLNRCGIAYEIVTGFLDDDNVWKEIEDWADATRVAKAMAHNRMGILGHYYGGMLDVYTDLTMLSGIFGTHFEILEMCELKKNWDAVTPDQVSSKIDEFCTAFDVSAECETEQLVRAARTSVALDKLATTHELSSLAYYYEGETDSEYQEITTSLIAGNTLLTGKNIPVAGECEVKNAHAMKIMSEFGAGGSFSEFYLIDFPDDVVYLGHDGPAHHLIAEGRVQLVPLPIYHGKPGKGLSIQMTVKHGPVTLLSVVEGRDCVFLLVAEGECVPGPILNIGNTNSRYMFKKNVRDFINSWSRQGPAHHCAIGVGHIAEKITKLAWLLDIDMVVV
jgi:L-arabinose isomerase